MAQVEEEKRQDEAVKSEVKKLLRETRLWRVANSAQWVAWGIVQTKVSGMDEALEAQKNSTPKSEDSIIRAPQAHLDSELEEAEEFDYLGYAQERAMFFWGDVLQLGIVKREDLPEELLNKVKVVEY